MVRWIYRLRGRRRWRWPGFDFELRRAVIMEYGIEWTRGDGEREGEREIQRGNTEVKYGENHPLEVVACRVVSAVFARCIWVAVFWVILGVIFEIQRANTEQIQRKKLLRVWA